MGSPPSDPKKFGSSWETSLIFREVLPSVGCTGFMRNGKVCVEDLFSHGLAWCKAMRPLVIHCRIGIQIYWACKSPWKTGWYPQKAWQIRQVLDPWHISYWADVMLFMRRRIDLLQEPPKTGDYSRTNTCWDKQPKMYASSYWKWMGNHDCAGFHSKPAPNNTQQLCAMRQCLTLWSAI